MRFSYCESLISKKSFFIFSIEYFFENEFNSILLKNYGLSKFFKFFSFMMFEFHNSSLNLNKTFLNIGLTKSRNFARLLLHFYQPHINVKNYFFLNVFRHIRPMTVRGFNFSSGMPMRSQRTHSNSKSVKRFRDYFLSYLSTVTAVDFSKYIYRIKMSAAKIKDIHPERIKKSKSKSKTKQVSKNAKNKKKKKASVWK